MDTGKRKFDLGLTIVNSLTWLLSLLLILAILVQITPILNNKPDFKITYRGAYTYKADWDSNIRYIPSSVECEINANRVTRQDFYDFCPYITKMLYKINYTGGFYEK